MWKDQWCIQRDSQTGILAWAPKFWHPKKKIYVSLYWYFLLQVMFFHCFQAQKHTLSPVNHSKAWKMCSLQGFHPTDGQQYFNMELLGIFTKTVCPKNLWIHHWRYQHKQKLLQSKLPPLQTKITINMTEDNRTKDSKRYYVEIF